MGIFWKNIFLITDVDKRKYSKCFWAVYFKRIIFKEYEGGYYMSYTTTYNKLMYVPFNHDYAVDEEIEKELSRDEFFEKCFVMPNFAKEKDELMKISSEEIKAFEVDLTKDEVNLKYEKQGDEWGLFHNWIMSNQNDMYCVRGDAGTGKSSFLHYLEYIYRHSNIRWCIIDIQKASETISILGNPVNIPYFVSLYSKSISAIILSIVDLLYYRKADEKIDYEQSANNLDRLVENYKKIFDGYFLNREVQSFYRNISKVVNNRTNDLKAKCIDSAGQVANHINNLFKNHNMKEEERLSRMIELYLSILRCINENVRYIVAFDNFERFVGVDEIFNGQLVEFVIKLREIQNSISSSYNGLKKYYQIIIFMRKTSTRMFPSQQSSELFEHSLDISEWFQISKILEKKIDWYREKNIEINEAKRIMIILSDVGGYGRDFRGLRSKLNMLFNYNKRVITRFISKILDKNYLYINRYDSFINNEHKITNGFSKFAARVIIFRLILNELRQDEFFSHIVVQKNNDESSSLGYARKILSILHDYNLENRDSYMPFDEIIEKIYPTLNNPIERYFDINNEDKRLIIAQVLFYMNYYNTRSDNWLQFIDIQYNMNNTNRIRVKDYEKLFELIDENHDNISIRITSAGKAYLYFVVYSFEYFACKSINIDKKLKDFGTDDLPPLFCAIPTKDEIKYNKYSDLLCMKIIKIVSNEAFLCINIMNSEENSIGFRRTIEDDYIYHKDRIINSHVGYIRNFAYILKDIYKNEMKDDLLLRNKVEKIMLKIEEIANRYLEYKS